jgi:protein-tyrosine-phosphatase
MKVLFVCSANVNRSQIAKASYNSLTTTSNADSAGIDVKNKAPHAKTLAEFDRDVKKSYMVEALSEKGIDVSNSPRQQLSPEMLSEYDLVVNIANCDQTPKWLKGENVIWWNVVDPHSESLEKVERARDEIEERVKKLIEIEQSGGDFHELDDGIDKSQNHSFVIRRGYIVFFLTDYVRAFNFPGKIGGGLTLKSNEFHVSLMKVPVDLSDEMKAKLNQVSVEASTGILKNQPKLNGEFRRAAQNDKEAIVALADFPAVESWRVAVREILPDVEFSVPHVTLYTKNGEGVGLDSEAEYAELTSELDPETDKTLRRVWEARNG